MGSYDAYMDTRKLGSMDFHCFYSKLGWLHQHRSASRAVDKVCKAPQSRGTSNKSCSHISFGSIHPHPTIHRSIKQELIDLIKYRISKSKTIAGLWLFES